jgi:hypothetical protein
MTHSTLRPNVTLLESPPDSTDWLKRLIDDNHPIANPRITYTVHGVKIDLGNSDA